MRADAPEFVPSSSLYHEQALHYGNATQAGIKKARRRWRKSNANTPKTVHRNDKCPHLETDINPTNTRGTDSQTWADIALKGHKNKVETDLALIEQQAERLHDLAKSHKKLYRLGKSSRIVISQKFPIENNIRQYPTLPPIENNTHKGPTLILPPINRYFKKHSEAFMSRWLKLKVELQEKVTLNTATASVEIKHYHDHKNDQMLVSYADTCTIHDDKIPSHQHDEMPSSQHPYPLHDAILRNDESLFKSLLAFHPESHFLMPIEELTMSTRIKVILKKNGIEKVSTVQLCVIINRSKFLRFLLEKSSDLLNDPTLPLIFLASIIPSHECLMIILNSAGPSVLFVRHGKKGDTPFHVACKTDQFLTVQTFLSFMTGKGASNAKILPKLLSCQNHNGETPLHLACAFSQLPTIEIILSTCTTSCGAKLLRIKDQDEKTPLFTAISRGSTDIVIHLLMWRGNHRDANTLKVESNDASYCPLTFASSTGSMDMISILLEYIDPLSTSANHECNIQQALHQAMFSFEPSKYRQVINILIKGGANPYNFPNPKLETHPSNDKLDLNQSPLLAAVHGRKYDFIDILLDEYYTNLGTIRRRRRQDSTLLKQPASYFASLESKEDDIMNDSIQDALVQSILLAWRCIQRDPVSSTAWNHLRSCLSIVKRSHSVSLSSLVRLYIEQIGRTPIFAFTFSYDHPCMEYTNPTSLIPVSIYDRSGAKGWSMMLAQTDWFWEMNGETYCPWLNSNKNKDICALDMDAFTIICNDGTKLIAHKSIISQKSEKIKAAIHFSDAISAESRTTIHLDGPTSILVLFLSHCYHGSIFHGLSADIDLCTEQLLELYLMAEEYLCTTLARECEMRLMSECPYKCYCWYCCSEIFSVDKDSVQCSSTCNTLHSSPFLNANIVLQLFTSISQDCTLSSHSTEFKNFITRTVLLKLDRILEGKIFLDHVNEIAASETDVDDMQHQVGAYLLRECLILLSSTSTFPPEMEDSNRKRMSKECPPNFRKRG